MSRLNVDKITGKTGTNSGAPITLSGDTATLGSGVAMAANHSGVKTALNATGDAPIYACRAWVNFNGTGTVAIRDSGNVSSITDNGTGDYTVNFTTAMPDANYSATSMSGSSPSSYQSTTSSVTTDGMSSSSITINNREWGTNTLYDLGFMLVAVFR